MIPKCPPRKPYQVEKKMSFRIDYESEARNLYVFYPFEGWDSDEFSLRDSESTLKVRQLIERLIKNRNNKREFKVLCEDFIRFVHGDSFSLDILQSAAIFLVSCGKLEVEGENGTVIYKNIGHKFQEEDPAIRELVPQCIEKEFCIVNIQFSKSCGVDYDHCGAEDFDMSLLKYSNGELYYDGEDFNYIGAEGYDSDWEIYVDGVMVYGCGVNLYSINAF
jgi:hypothetical protein